jgi:uncharacterized FlaG/YvyC family protein
MTENMISNMGNNGPVDLGSRVSKPVSGQATSPDMAMEAVVRQDKKAAPQETKAETKTDKPALNAGDVSLEFKIDSESQDVTILILDRTSRKVVRTIPPEEMSNLDPGELVQLFA